MNKETTSDTPETDDKEFSASTIAVNLPPPHARFTHANFARKLERERDQWVAKAAELSAERDEARAQLREERQLHSQTLDERDEARNLFESSKRARASLNEACDHLQRERDRLQKLAEVNGKLAHSSACEAMEYRSERDEARAVALDMRNQFEKTSTARLIFPWENAKVMHGAKDADLD